MNSPYEFDLFDPEQTQHMWDLMAELRQKCPVAEPAKGLFYTSRYDDTQHVFRDARLYSCEGGFRAPGVEIPEDELFMSEMDAPTHPKLRKLLHPWFTPATTRQAEPFTQEYVERVLDELEAAGGGDLVELVSARLWIAVTGHILGIPVDDIPDLARWIFELLHTDWPAYGARDVARLEETRGIARSAPQLSAYVDNLIAARRARADEEADDLLGQIVFAELDGKQVSNDRARSLIINLLTAGLSTNSLIGNLLYRLVTSAEIHERVRNDPVLSARLVEESLRFEPPVMFLFRTALEDVDISNAHVNAGDRVAVGIASANRDEEMYRDGNEFRLADNDPENLTFGAGPHLCLGAHLARMQARVVVEGFVRRYSFDEVELAPGYQYSLIPTFLEYGPDRVDVVLKPRASRA